MFRKQWLNHYEWKDTRMSAIERSWSRQQKLDGIDAWYLNYVLELSPLLLQAALLLLGCALLLYLRGIDTTTSSLAIGITLLGFASYLFIIVAGATVESCPYQSPELQAVRYLGQKIRNTFRKTIKTIRNNAKHWWPRSPGGNITHLLRDLFPEGPPPIVLYPLHDIYPTPQLPPTFQTTPLDFRCISWTFHASFDQVVRTTALKYLASMRELTQFDPSLVVDCFDIFVGAICVDDKRGWIALEGLESLATMSAMCLYRTFHRLAVTDPTSSVLKAIRRRYLKRFSKAVNFTQTPCPHTMIMVHALIAKDWSPRLIWHSGGKPSDHDHLLFAKDITELAQVEYKREQKVPKWSLGFSFDSLSMDTQPQESIIANCLTVIMIHLGCDISHIDRLDKR